MNLLMFIYELIYGLSLIEFSVNAIVYVVAASALLCKLNSTMTQISLTVETKTATFYAYKLIFSLIVLESLLLVIFLEGVKQQIGVLIWIIYVSALMVLFLIFLALTITDSFFFYKKRELGDIKNSDMLNLNSNAFNFGLYLFFFIYFSLNAFEIVELLTVREYLSPILNSAYNYKLNDSQFELIGTNDIFNIIKRDISNSASHYILSCALQVVCMVVVISALIF